MRRLLLASCIALATLSGCASTGAASSPDIASVLASPTRSAEDKERDARDKPAEVLALAGFERGDTVADVFAGGGYYSEILAGIVGPEGGCCWPTTPATTISARRAGPHVWRTIACRT